MIKFKSWIVNGSGWASKVKVMPIAIKWWQHCCITLVIHFSGLILIAFNCSQQMNAVLLIMWIPLGYSWTGNWISCLTHGLQICLAAIVWLFVLNFCNYNWWCYGIPIFIISKKCIQLETICWCFHLWLF